MKKWLKEIKTAVAEWTKLVQDSFIRNTFYQ